MRMTSNYECLHEEQIQGISRKTAELKARADYKDRRIDELKEDMLELKQSVNSLEKTINNYILKSITDDNTLKDYVNKLENRVTSLESRQDTLYKLLVTIPSIITVIGAIVVYINYIH